MNNSLKKRSLSLPASTKFWVLTYLLYFKVRSYYRWSWNINHLKPLKRQTLKNSQICHYRFCIPKCMHALTNGKSRAEKLQIILGMSHTDQSYRLVFAPNNVECMIIMILDWPQKLFGFALLVATCLALGCYFAFLEERWKCDEELW